MFFPGNSMQWLIDNLSVSAPFYYSEKEFVIVVVVVVDITNTVVILLCHFFFLRELYKKLPILKKKHWFHKMSKHIFSNIMKHAIFIFGISAQLLYANYVFISYDSIYIKTKQKNNRAKL